MLKSLCNDCYYLEATNGDNSRIWCRVKSGSHAGRFCCRNFLAKINLFTDLRTKTEVLN